MVSNTPEDERGRVYDQVENVHRVRPKEKPKLQVTEDPDDLEEEFEKIPF
jgi:hypothetical protein